MSAATNRFLLRNPENADFNQYWYSIGTIDAVVREIKDQAQRSVAFVSTPSLYFSLQEYEKQQQQQGDANSTALSSRSKLFDFDLKWKANPGFVHYDYNKPTDVPAELHHTFDYVVVDPPFITRDVWEKYIETVRLLLVPEGGKFLFSTIPENEAMLREVLGSDVELRVANFKPRIPNLVYQYVFYTNYDSELLRQRNPEVVEDDDE
eukprot:GEZU01019192.1.p1 GENE.GEZU01019192.1~~GEZU01019192.1.p1  ORF type:complete len:236 (-),score=47.56 GEZU01019192.1:46-666(-)